MEYPKTENLWTRDNDGDHKLNVGEYKVPEHGQVGQWLITEKIDGTNIRLVLDWRYLGDSVGLGRTGWEPVFEVRGRSDAANLPPNFQAEALPGLDVDGMLRAWEYVHHVSWVEHVAEGKTPATLVLYGEGYGPGIQKGGGAYADHKSFALFDVATFERIESPPSWRTWEVVEDVAERIGVSTVPVIDYAAPIPDIQALVAHNLGSAFPGVQPEGVVARTDPYLYTRRGSRVMFKLKGGDLRSEGSTV